MFNKTQLNMVVKKAAAGCESSRFEIIGQLAPMIQRLSEGIWHLVRDQTSFEQECYKRIDYEILHYDESKTTLTFLQFIRKKFYQVRNKHIKKRSIQRERLTSIEALAGGDDEGNARPFEIEDVLADVELTVLHNEKIASLAGDDLRKLSILAAWTYEFNDSETAAILANRFGGKSESHRKFIRRYRTICQTTLSSVI